MKLGVHREQLAPALSGRSQLVLERRRISVGILPAAVAAWAIARNSRRRSMRSSPRLADTRAGRSRAHHEQRRLRRPAREAARALARACRRIAAAGGVVNVIPLFPLNIVLFPERPLPLRIFETRYVDMVRRCMREDQGFGVVLIREGRGGRVPPISVMSARWPRSSISISCRRPAGLELRRPAALSDPCAAGKPTA
jgi:hypothetical protein